MSLQCIYCMSLAPLLMSSLFFFNDTATTEIYTLSLHDALPIFAIEVVALDDHVAEIDADAQFDAVVRRDARVPLGRSEEHTSELQSHSDLVCRLLLEKKNK